MHHSRRAHFPARHRGKIVEEAFLVVLESISFVEEHEPSLGSLGCAPSNACHCDDKTMKETGVALILRGVIQGVRRFGIVSCSNLSAV